MQSVVQQATSPPERPLRIQQYVPIMHTPGEISQIANIFDNRMFEEGNSEQNIEFHIHAFLTPQGAANSPPTGQNPPSS